MSSNFERVHEILNQANFENFSCLSNAEPKICQDSPNQRQDDPVFSLYPRTMDTQRELFSKIPNFWAWADKLGRKCLGHFYKKTNFLYPHPKYLFGIGILIWAAKN